MYFLSFQLFVLRGVPTALVTSQEHAGEFNMIITI